MNSFFQADHRHRAEHQGQHEADRHQWDPARADPDPGAGHDGHRMDQLLHVMGVQQFILQGK